MGRPFPDEPVVFMKPDSSILKNNKPFFLPDFSSEIHYEVEVVVKISRLGKGILPKFAPRYYDEITAGIDITARDLQAKLSSQASLGDIQMLRRSRTDREIHPRQFG
jgi:2-keto-4-pentenoate hydratase/2-oxohepta-3-ene-1,7-dioic acid hydratase in catechol pathway